MYVHKMYTFVDEVHPKKKKKLKQEPVGDVETTERGEEHIKKKRKIKSEPAGHEGVTYGKKFIGFLLCFDICPC
jgi:hypothetical protein